MKPRHLLPAALVLISSFAVSPSALAQQVATPVNGDTRLVTFDYDPDVTYLLLTRPKSVTHVMLAPGEQVVSLVAGDTVNFVFQVSASREHIFVKPKFEGMTTSASLVTSKASYQFILRSANESGKWHQRVSWNNPEMVLQDVAGTAPVASVVKASAQAAERPARLLSGEAGFAIEKLNFEYAITGDTALKPAQVFDDGIRTYFRIPANMQELPALFGVKDGEASLVNYKVKDGYIVAQSTSGSFVLKLGKEEARVEKEAKKGFFGSAFNGK